MDEIREKDGIAESEPVEQEKDTAAEAGEDAVSEQKSEMAEKPENTAAEEQTAEVAETEGKDEKSLREKYEDKRADTLAKGHTFLHMYLKRLKEAIKIIRFAVKEKRFPDADETKTIQENTTVF